MPTGHHHNAVGRAYHLRTSALAGMATAAHSRWFTIRSAGQRRPGQAAKRLRRTHQSRLSFLPVRRRSSSLLQRRTHPINDPRAWRLLRTTLAHTAHLCAALKASSRRAPSPECDAQHRSHAWRCRGGGGAKSDVAADRQRHLQRTAPPLFWAPRMATLSSPG